MKKLCLLLTLVMVLGLAGCGKSETKTDAKKETASQTNDEGITEEEIVFSDIVKIELSNSEILVDGEKISLNNIGLFGFREYPRRGYK